MAFVFRLQTLLDKRVELRKQAEDELKIREKELAAERKTLQEFEQAAQEQSAKLRRKRSERSTAGKSRGMPILIRTDSLSGLEIDVQEARSAVFSQQILVDQALELVADANATLTTRRMDEEVLEKYRQKMKTRFDQEESYKEELEQDEIGNVMHLSRRARA